MGDKLLLNFWREILALIFIISHVKLQNCHGNGPTAQCQDITDEDVLCRTTEILEIFVEDTIGNL